MVNDNNNNQIINNLVIAVIKKTFINPVYPFINHTKVLLSPNYGLISF